MQLKYKPFRVRSFLKRIKDIQKKYLKNIWPLHFFLVNNSSGTKAVSRNPELTIMKIVYSVLLFFSVLWLTSYQTDSKNPSDLFEEYKIADSFGITERFIKDG
jgi:hypothetical protein